MYKYLVFLSLLFCCNFPTYSSQQYEVLKEETKQLMSQMVADRPPNFSSFSTSEDERKWVALNETNIKKYISDESERHLLLKTIHYEASRAGLEPRLVLGLIMVESGFKKYAFSSVGARGYMQIMPFWIKLIGNDKQNLFHLRTNLRYGCTILRHYLDIEKGNLFRALGRYNGSLGKSQYPNAVFSSMKYFYN